LTGIVPVAGLGTRMLPLTERIPKALVTINGRTLLERGIELLDTIGVDEWVVVVGHHEGLIRDHLTRLSPRAPVHVVHQAEQRGLVHALDLAKSRVVDDAVLLCPDNIFSDTCDLRSAAQSFRELRPAVLQVSTFAGDLRKNRTDFDLNSLETLASNMFRHVGSTSRGIPIRSTGVTFFSGEALSQLPDRFGPGETTLASVLVDLRERVDFLVTVLRGARFDITSPRDITAFEELERTQKNARRIGVSALLMNAQGAVLMQLRDDKPEIRFPGTWGLFGGSVDEGETPQAAIVREVSEELGYRLTHFGQIRCYVFEGKLEYAFLGLVDVPKSRLRLREGRAFDFFPPEVLKTMSIRPDDRATLADYFGWEAD